MKRDTRNARAFTIDERKSVYKQWEWESFADWSEKWLRAEAKRRRCGPKMIDDADLKLALVGAMLQSPLFTIRNSMFTTKKNSDLALIDPFDGQLILDIAIESQRKRGFAQRVIEIKPRQVGWTAWNLARAAWTGLQPRKQIAFFIPDQKVADELTARFGDIYNNLGWMAPMRRIENRSAVVFANPNQKLREDVPGLDTSITFSVPSGQRGRTPNMAVLSEFAHWVDKGFDPAGLMDALLSGMSAGPESCVIIDTTPNGFDDDYWPLVEDAIKDNPKWVKGWERRTIPTREDIINGVLGEPDEPDGWVPAFVSFLWHPEFTTKDESQVGQLPRPTKAKLDEFRDTFGKDEKYGGSEEKELVDRYGATEGRLLWRRWKIKNDTQGYDPRQKLLTFRQEYACVVGSTLVGTEAGIMPIANMENRLGARTQFGTLIAWQDKGVKPTVEVRTRSGFVVRCTPDHRILTDEGFVAASGSLGTRAAIASPDMARAAFIGRWAGFGGVEQRLTVTPDWGKFLGYFMADGSFLGDTLAFACDAQDEDVVEDVVAVVQRLFGKGRAEAPRAGCVYVRANSSLFEALFQRMGLLEINKGGRLKRRVCVPRCIWESPPEVIGAFLQALFEGDGYRTVNGSNVKFFTKHEQFARDVQLLLLAFGIWSEVGLRTSRRNGVSYPGYELWLRTSESPKFLDQIGFVSRRKSFREEAVLPKRGIGRPRREYDGFDDVVSVVETPAERVYDISVECDESAEALPHFVANGIVVHNTSWKSPFVDFGNNAFDPLGLDAITRMPKPPMARGMLRRETKHAVQEWYIDQTFHSDWEDMRFWAPSESGEQYVIGVDLGWSFETSEADETYAQILRRRDRKQVAVYQARAPMHRVREALYLLYLYYNRALTGIETKGPGKNLVFELYQMGMTNQYKWKRLDREDVKETDWLGWETSEHTRGTMEGILVEEIAWRDKDDVPCPGIILRDEVTVDQLVTVKRYPDGKIKARSGHDDAVDALMIALAVDRDPLRPYVPPRAEQALEVDRAIALFTKGIFGNKETRNEPQLVDM